MHAVEAPDNMWQRFVNFCNRQPVSIEFKKGIWFYVNVFQRLS